MVPSPRQRLILPLAPTGAGVAGVFTALMFAVLPSSTLESLVVDSGIASLLNAAQPPLGLTARAMLALVGGGVVSVLAWVALFVAVGTRSVIVQNPRATGDNGPALRRADVHPDAPPRQPVFANRDLGTPFLDIRAEAAPAPATAMMERDVPADLDIPLAAFDPQSFAAPPSVAVPGRSMPLARIESTEAPLPIRLDTGSALDRIAASMRHAPYVMPHDIRGVAPEPAPVDHDEAAVTSEPISDTSRAIERIATFMQHGVEPDGFVEPEPAEPLEAPMPIRLGTGATIDLIAASMQQPVAGPREKSPDSIHALLDRLERSVAHRDAEPSPAVPSRQARQDSIRDTLDTLRGLATRTG